MDAKTRNTVITALNKAADQLDPPTKVSAGLESKEEQALFKYLESLAESTREYNSNNSDAANGDHMEQIADELADMLVNSHKMFKIGDYGHGYVKMNNDPNSKKFIELAERATEASLENEFAEKVADAIKYADADKPRPAAKAGAVVYEYQADEGDGVEDQADTRELAELVEAVGSLEGVQRVAEELDRKADGVGWDAPGDKRQHKGDFSKFVDSVNRGWGALIRVPVYDAQWHFYVDVDDLAEELEDLIEEAA
jgi:hypothetical protein